MGRISEKYTLLELFSALTYYVFMKNQLDSKTYLVVFGWHIM